LLAVRQPSQKRIYEYGIGLPEYLSWEAATNEWEEATNKRMSPARLITHSFFDSSVANDPPSSMQVVHIA